MAPGAPAPDRYTSTRFFALVGEGSFHPDDRVELLEGVIVSMAPSGPRHASAIARVAKALERVLGDRGVVRVQLPLVAEPASVPEPDVAVVPGRLADYDERHPSVALLVVEVADTSLPQDRLTKSRIYAAACIPEFWIVNLRDDVVEVSREPDAAGRLYARRSVVGRGGMVEPLAAAGAALLVDELLPGVATR
jgi:Uma2 family endonuclease